MGFSRRTLGIASVVIILLGALGGIYIRLRALQAEEENGGVEAAEGEAQEVESAQAFRSDIAIPVGAAPVVRDTLVMSVSAAGQAQAFARTLLAAEVEGPVTQVLVREGDWVRRGQVLARIDPERFAFELERAHAQLEQAEANFAELTLFDDEIADEELRAERRRLARARSGLAAAEAIESLRDVRVDVKWPNDLQIEGKKVAGILAESAILNDQVVLTVAGIGINVSVRFEPDDPLAETATSLLVATGEITDRATLLARIMAGLNRWNVYLRDRALDEAWRARMVILGQRVRAMTQDGLIDGVAEDIDATGALWFRPDGGETVRLMAGEVSLLPPDEEEAGENAGPGQPRSDST